MRNGDYFYRQTVGFLYRQTVRLFCHWDGIFRRRLCACLVIIIPHFSFLIPHSNAQTLSFVELNCENLFDYSHDIGKDDAEYLPDAIRHWNRKRYWRKLNNIGQELLSCSSEGIPDLIALCEVENDSVLRDLTRRSLLRNARYEYVMTSSPDLRGIDVALLYQPYSFAPIRSYSLRVTPVEGMRPTRDILYVAGLVKNNSESDDSSGSQAVQNDTLHIFVVHAPSRFGGERYSRPFRLAVADRLCVSVDSIRMLSPEARIIVAGDFNDAADSPALQQLYRHGLHCISHDARGQNGARGTYRYRGEWGSIDHILVSPPLQHRVDTVFIHAPSFLLEEEKVYGGFRPRRTYNGYRYQPGYSDHLPLVVKFN